MTAIRNYLNKKGQGIVEYAVLLAFIVGLAAFLGSGGIKDSVAGVFDSVVELLDSATGSQTPEEKEATSIKAFANLLAEKFTLGKHITANNKDLVDEQSKTITTSGSWMGIVVFPDGTVDVIVDAWGTSHWVSDWNDNSAYPARQKHYDAYMSTINDALNVKNSTELAQKYGVTSSNYPNGYAIIYDSDSNKPTVRTVSLSSNSKSEINLHTLVNTNTYTAVAVE